MSAIVFASDKVCGEVLNTDIKAYIDGLPIKSYNIDGWTGVVAEDLRYYGFEVEWNAEERTLHIGKSVFPTEITANYQFEENTRPVGSHAAYVYETDIKTYVYGKEVTAFNIGGWTIIYIDELQVFGDVVWNPDERKISYTYRKPWSIGLVSAGTGIMHEGLGPYKDGIRDVSGTFVRNTDGSFSVQGNNLGHISWVDVSFDKRYGGLQFGFSMVAHHLLADYEFSQLCSSMCTVNYDGTRLKDNADLANKHTKIYINGEAVIIKDVRMGKGNNHHDYYFVLDLSIEKDDINKISFECGL